MKQTVTIIGCGSTGMAAAHHFTKSGIRTVLCDTAERISFMEDIQKQGGIRICGVYEDEQPVMPEAVTQDFQAAMSHSNHILICASADRQVPLARQFAPYLTDNHSILLSPGNLGSVLLRPITGSGVQLGELSDNLWPCRIAGPAQVLLGLPLGKKRAAAFPASDTDALINMWDGLLPLNPGSNILETALNSPNVISHVAGSILNTAAIEQAGGKFAFFRDGLSLSVIRVLETIERERNQVLSHLGLDIYNETAPLLYGLLNGGIPGFEIFSQLDGPENLAHRYIAEDAQCGVALLVSIADKYLIPVPITKAVLSLAECINRANYQDDGRTLEMLGLKGETVNELLKQI